jgi:hypothetical protein
VPGPERTFTVLEAMTCGLIGVDVGEGGKGVGVSGATVRVGVGTVVGVDVAMGGLVAVGITTTIAVPTEAGVKVGAGVRVVRTVSSLTLKSQAKRAVAPK